MSVPFEAIEILVTLAQVALQGAVTNWRADHDIIARAERNAGRTGTSASYVSSGALAKKYGVRRPKPRPRPAWSAAKAPNLPIGRAGRALRRRRPHRSPRG